MNHATVLAKASTSPMRPSVNQTTKKIGIR